MKIIHGNTVRVAREQPEKKSNRNSLSKFKGAFRSYLIKQEKSKGKFEHNRIFRPEFIHKIQRDFNSTIPIDEYLKIIVEVLFEYKNGTKREKFWKKDLDTFFIRMRGKIKHFLPDNEKNVIQHTSITDSKNVFDIPPAKDEEIAILAVQHYKVLVKSGKKEKVKQQSVSRIIPTKRPAVKPQIKPSLKNIKIADHIIPVASGKGGTGKSLVASNLAIGFASLGYKVTLVDADLGTPNLHNYLYEKRAKYSLDDVFISGNNDYSRAVSRTKYKNLKLLYGASNIPEIANIHPKKIRELIKGICSLSGDIVIVDIGAGTNRNCLDLFNMAPAGIMVVNPEQSSIQDAYLFLKTALFRRLKLLSSRDSDLGKAFSHYLTQENNTELNIPDFIGFLSGQPGKAESEFAEFLLEFQPGIIMNKVNSGNNSLERGKLVRLVQKFMSIELSFLGEIKYSKRIGKSYLAEMPVLSRYPRSDLAKNIFKIIKKLEDSEFNGSRANSFKYFSRELQSL
ncbi:MAG: MinD/ParA family protein [bacterium]|nr:MinD/ParA family protein [bacterium]